MLQFEVMKGQQAAYTVTVRDGSGNPITAFTGDENLTFAVWPGDDLPAAGTGQAQWKDAAAGTIDVVLDATLTTSLEPGIYRWTLTLPDVETELACGMVRVRSAPGTGTALPVYGTIEDLRRECSWIEQLQDELQDQTGFREQRAMARQWLDGLILGAAPAGLRWDGLGATGPWGGTIPGPWSWGISATAGWPANWFGSSLLADSWLAGLLATGGPFTAPATTGTGALVLTGPRGAQALRACACYALSLILRSQIGKRGSSYQGMAGYYAQRAQAEASTLVCEIDTDADGVAELAIPLGVTNTRHA